MHLIRWAGLIAGAFLLIGTSLSVLHTVAGPRGRSSRLAAGLGRSVEMVGRFVARRLNSPQARDRVLVLVGPMAFLVVLFAWLTCYVVGFAMLNWPLVGDLRQAFRLAGSSVFTLGFAVPTGSASTLLAFLAASTGLVVVALELAYLPSLYAAYNRRECLVTQLAARCAGRLTGDQLLLAHLRLGWAEGLTDLYGQWERWAADVRETHTNYPILTSFRASDPTAPWPYALLAVLDAAALQNVLLPDSCSPQSMVTLSIGIETLRSIAPRPGRLSDVVPNDIDLGALVRELRAATLTPQADLDRCARQFGEFRSRYLPAVHALATQLLLEPIPLEPIEHSAAR